MIEREMEDLIAAHAEDFFPRRVLALKGRQGIFAGIGRFDLLFEDQFKNNLLMELKAVPAKLDVAEQLVKYKQALEERGEKNVIMWLVAPIIPRHVADFLDRFGVEHTEIHEAEFRQVASRYDYSFVSESAPSRIDVAAPPSPIKAAPQNREAGFDEAMLSIYERAKADCKYNAARFLQMVGDRGGLQTAKYLLHAPGLSDGFTALWECKRLDLTVEALVLKPEWRGLFTDQELEIAAKRLSDLGYCPPNARSTPLPNLDTLRAAVLRVFADGLEHSREEVQDRMRVQFEVSQNEPLEKNKGGTPIFHNHVAIALANLQGAPHRGPQYIEKVGNEVYRITGRGKDILKRNPSTLTIKDLG